MEPCEKLNILCLRGHSPRGIRAPTQRETVFANHVSGEGLISRISGELQKLHNQTNRIYKWAKVLNGHFSKASVWMGGEHLQRWSLGTCKYKPQAHHHSPPPHGHCHRERDREQVLARALLPCPHLKVCCRPVLTWAPSHLRLWTTRLSCPWVVPAVREADPLATLSLLAIICNLSSPIRAVSHP